MPKPILFHFIYELGFSCLLMLVFFLPIPHALDQTLSIGIWVILVVDFGTRFILAEKKGLFFRRHILEFVAILPFGFFFQSIRLIRVIQMLRTVFFSPSSHSSDGPLDDPLSIGCHFSYDPLSNDWECCLNALD